MNTPINHGGNAFPIPYDASPGMTMRQWYAGMALQGIMANTHFMAHLLISNGMKGDAIAIAAAQAFLAADSMIAQETQPIQQ